MRDAKRRMMRLGSALLTTTATAALMLPTSEASAFARLSGDFLSTCDYSHSLPDDPIVSPGQAGASHLHDFFGNATTNSESTYESLRAAGTTCKRIPDTAAYWVPALYQNGRQVKPSQIGAYYRTSDKDPSTISPFPADLRVIAGDAHNTDLTESVATWTCEPFALGNPEHGCPIGTHLRVVIIFPDCWDGTRLDSADHKAHMAYAEGGTCPTSHPVGVPQLELQVSYPNAQGGHGWSLSSGSPASAHADFVNAWDQQTLTDLVNNCIRSGLGRADGVIC